MTMDNEEFNAVRRRQHDFDVVVLASQVSNLVSMFTEHKSDSKAFMGEARDTLAEINDQVTRTNGRVNGHDREIKDMKDTLTWAIRLVLGLNASVVVGVIVYWVTHK